MVKYFQDEVVCTTDKWMLDLRARTALSLLEHNGIITGKNTGEDSQGRAKLSEMPAKEIVTRAFDMAEEFVRICEERGYIKPCIMTWQDSLFEKAAAERQTWIQQKDDKPKKFAGKGE